MLARVSDINLKIGTLSRPPFPAETFGNLLLLYVKYQYYDLAADVLAENKKLHDTHLGKELYDFLEAVILTQSSPTVKRFQYSSGIL